MNITNKNIYNLNLKEKYDSNAVFLLEIIEKADMKRILSEVA